MNSDWNKYLTEQGAVIQDDRVTSFGDATSQTYSLEQTYLCDLSNLGLIRAAGEDAQSFLHGQFTNDLNLVSHLVNQLSSYCNPKGRMLSIFRIFMREDNYHILLHHDVLDSTLKKLTMFKLMSKVDLSDISNELVTIGLAGPDTESVLESLSLAWPNEVNHSTQNGETTVLRVPCESKRVLIITNVAQAISIWNQCSKNIPAASYKLWDLHDIVSGIPQVTAKTTEAFIPQMTNLELIEGVSFSKGCYPGQEVVARTHYLGKPNRRMYRVTIADEAIPEPGVNIFSSKDENQPVGKIVIAQKSSETVISALVVMRIKNENDEDLHLASTSGPQVTVQSLPYSLNVEAK